MTGPLAYQFRPAAVLEVSGEDAFGFLQGQFSNDIRPKSPGTVTYGLWLSVKGKVGGDAFLIQRDSGRFLLVSPDCPSGAMRSRLESFIIADDVTLKDVTSHWNVIAVWGPDAGKSAEALGVEVPSGRQAVAGGGLVGFASHRWGAGTIEWLFEEREGDSGARTDELDSAGFSFLTAAGAERERILCGGVSVPSELGSGDLPQEAGVEAVAVSFTKGCFIGQEVMARLKSMGRVRRGLVRVRGEGVPPPVPVPLFSAGRKFGELRSIAPLEAGGFVGRAMVTLTNLPWRLSLGSSESDAPVVVRDDP